jgi:DNA polymerase III subunit chi
LRVDFYQLAGSAPEAIIGRLAERLLAEDQRLLIVASDEGMLARLDRQLWDQGPTSFLPHGISGGGDDTEQPILLSTTPDAPNRARNMLIADGEWRDAALSFDRAFYLFDEGTLQGARLAWKLLVGREGIERYYHAQEDGRWQEKSRG